jgi:hypothetical protein
MLVSHIPSVQEVLGLLNKSHSGTRFGHCDGDNTHAAIYEDGERFECFKCGARGNSLDLLESLGHTPQQVEEMLSVQFPGFTRYDSRFSVDPLRKALTAFTQMAHGILMSEQPAIQEIRAWIKQKWGLDEYDLVRFGIGLASEKMLVHLPMETQDALRSIDPYQGVGFSFHRYLIFPEYKNGYLHYFQARSTDPDCPKNMRHLKPKKEALPSSAFGYYTTYRLLSKATSPVPLLIVEGICDYYALSKLGFAVVATLGANIKNAKVIGQIAELNKMASATIVEFDKEPNSINSRPHFELAKSLCQQGIDAIPTITSPESFLSVLPHELVILDKLDVAEIVARTPVEVATHLFEEKYRNLRGVDEAGDRHQEPRTFLREFVSQADSPKAMEEAYGFLSMQPEGSKPQYYDCFKRKFNHQVQDIKSYIKKFKPKQVVEHEEIEEFEKYDSPNSCYKKNPYDGTMYITKSGFTKSRVVSDDGEAETVEVLTILTVKQTLKSGEVTTVLDEQTQIAGAQALGQMGSNYPTCSMTKEIGPYWKPSVPKPDVDHFALNRVSSNFEGAVSLLNIKDLYINIVYTFTESVYFTDKRYAQICALYCFMTHVFPMFEAIPYLHLVGPKGSGKTQLLSIFKRLTAKPYLTAVMSPSSLFRIVEQQMPTLIMDEKDGMATEKELDPDIRALHNSGYNVNGLVTRTEPIPGTGQFKIVSFSCFSPKIYAGTKKLYDILASRCIPIRTKPVPPEEWGNLKLVSVLDKRGGKAQSYQNQLIVWSMTCGLQLEAEHLKTQVDPLFRSVAHNRQAELYGPLLSILRLIGDPMGFEADFLRFVQEQQIQSVIKTNSSLSSACLRAICKMHDLAATESARLGLGVYEWEQGSMRVIATPARDWLHDELVKSTPNEEVNVPMLLGVLVREGYVTRSTTKSASHVNTFGKLHTPSKAQIGYYFHTFIFDMVGIRQTLKTMEVVILDENASDPTATDD